MSGDVQPRKRKDKKKKREDEASHGVHFTKMGSDDVHLHVHEEHGTGGDWCSKIIFFSLMILLMSLVGLIIIENRGISNVDTPLSKSRFSNYFDGWVDENRDDHDDHHDTHGSLEHDDHDEHDDDEDAHDEPFEEEADHSEGDEEVAEKEDENVTPEEEDDDDNATAENVTGEKDEEEQEEDDEENITAEEDNVTAEDENVTEEATVELNDKDDENDENKTNEDYEDGYDTTETSKPTASQAVQDDDEEDDDDTFDPLEKIVDNDAAEIELLKEKARQQAAAESKENLTSAEKDLQDEAENAPSWASSLAIKIGIGLALALVARLVLIRKNPISNEAAPVPEHLMTRRLTIASPDEFIPEDADVIDEPLLEDDYSEEEIEIEEEIEYIEEDVEATGEENQVDAGDNDYAPETFEQLNAMYRSKDCKEETQKQIETKQSTKTEPYSYQSPYHTSSNNNNNRHNNNNSDTNIELPKSSNNSYNKNTQHQAVSKVVASPPLAETKTDVQAKYSPPKELAIKSETSTQPLKKDVTYDMDYEKTEKEKPPVEHKKEISHDMDYQPDADEIDYDEDDIYDDDEAQDDDSEDLDDDDLLDDDDDEEDLEEGDVDEEVSDVDDTELMDRLEAKYGKLPAKEYESDEDPNDPTWTQIKPKTGGGSQSFVDDEEEDLDLFEAQLQSANDEMMRGYYDDALYSFEQIIKKFPKQPQGYLGKAQTLDMHSELRNSKSMLLKAIGFYKKYLKFNVVEDQLLEYRSAAERCMQKMRYLDQHEQCLPIHNLLIKKFPNIPSIRNDLVVTYIMLDRLLDAKQVLQDTLKIWPQDGYALVHYGFLLKYIYQDYHNASIYLRRGIDSKAEGTQDGRFYFLLGESLQRLGKQGEAEKIFRRGANLRLYPSTYQRSLINEPNLKAQPFWTVEETTYERHLKKIQDHWSEIRTEGLRALRHPAAYLDESENLKDKGEWKQFELYFRGQQNQAHCLMTPLTCSLIEEFPAARDCRRGQIKFSVIQTGTHVWPHCGPTNCRIRAHLGLVVPNGPRIRVAGEERSWEVGKFLIFDDSFEHEVWHEGRGIRLVLIIDMWHPQLSEHQRRSLYPI